MYGFLFVEILSLNRSFTIKMVAYFSLLEHQLKISKIKVNFMINSVY